MSWVEDTIAFEQAVFLRHMTDGWDVIGARMWFEDLQEADGESRSGLWILVKALTDAVVRFHQYFPPTLTLDHKRLRHLQFAFQVLVYQAACGRTLKNTLREIGWMGKLSKERCADLFSRVAVLISDPGLQYDFWQMRESVALEIVRAAYAISRNGELPIPKDLDFAEEGLRDCCDPKKPVFEVLRSSLAVDLADRVDDEVSVIGDLSPDQLMRRLLPPQPGFSVQSDVEGLVHIAKRIAHIAELHWRTWGPILYQQPLDVVCEALGRRSSVEEDANESGSLHSSSYDESEEWLSDTTPD